MFAGGTIRLQRKQNPWKLKLVLLTLQAFQVIYIYNSICKKQLLNCCARDGTAIALPMRLFVEQHMDACANATGRNILTSFDFWHCPVFERDETMPAFAPVPAAQDLLPPMVSLHWWKSCQWKSVFFFCGSLIRSQVIRNVLACR